MNLLSVSLRNLRVRALSSILTIVSIALGTALLAALWLLLAEAERKYQASAEGYGIVVGPKEGSGLEIVLSTVLNFTDLAPPAGLVPFSVYRELHDGPARRKFGVRYAIPQCRGDNYRGFPVIGTTDEMFSQFSRGSLGEDSEGNRIPRLLEFAAGGPFAFSHDELVEFAEHLAEHHTGADHHDHAVPESWRVAVIGASVAKKIERGVGDTITPEHGVAEEATSHVHEEAICTIVGVLAETRTPVDRAIFIPAGTFLLMDKHDAIRSSQEASAGNVGLSAIIVDTVRSSFVGQKLRYEFQTRPDGQAVVPWLEIAKLVQVVGDVSTVLAVVSYLVLVVAAISILVALYNTMNERRREIAIMRSLGARRGQIIRVILQEASLVSLVGGACGVMAAHLAALALANEVERLTGIAVDWAAFSVEELWLILGITALGGVAGVLPAIKGSLTSVADHLGPVS